MAAHTASPKPCPNSLLSIVADAKLVSEWLKNIKMNRYFIDLKVNLVHLQQRNKELKELMTNAIFQTIVVLKKIPNT